MMPKQVEWDTFLFNNIQKLKNLVIFGMIVQRTPPIRKQAAPNLMCTF